jgi:hypothetical protein
MSEFALLEVNPLVEQCRHNAGTLVSVTDTSQSRLCVASRERSIETANDRNLPRS